MSATLYQFPVSSLDRWRQVDAYMLAAGETVAKLGEMSVFYNDRTRHSRDIAALIIAGRRQPVLRTKGDST